MVYTLRSFPLQNAVCFIILTYLVPVLFTFYVQGVLKLKKKQFRREKDKSDLIPNFLRNFTIVNVFLILKERVSNIDHGAKLTEILVIFRSP